MRQACEKFSHVFSYFREGITRNGKKFERSRNFLSRLKRPVGRVARQKYIVNRHKAPHIFLRTFYNHFAANCSSQSNLEGYKIVPTKFSAFSVYLSARISLKSQLQTAMSQLF